MPSEAERLRMANFARTNEEIKKRWKAHFTTEPREVAIAFTGALLELVDGACERQATLGEIRRGLAIAERMVAQVERAMQREFQKKARRN